MNISRTTKEDLIEKAYKEHFEHLYSYALILTKSEDLAKDVVSEVFFNLLKANTDFSSIKLVRSYLFTCIRNQAIRMKTNDPYYYESERKDIACMDTIDPEELLIGKELDRFLQNVIDNLPPQCGLVFKMVKEDRMKYGEVARELGISVDTVKYHLKTAVKTIKAKLKDHFEDTKVIPWFSSGTIVLVLSKLIFLI